jgi:hypothetical protein
MKFGELVVHHSMIQRQAPSFRFRVPPAMDACGYWCGAEIGRHASDQSIAAVTFFQGGMSQMWYDDLVATSLFYEAIVGYAASLPTQTCALKKAPPSGRMSEKQVATQTAAHLIPIDRANNKLAPDPARTSRQGISRQQQSRAEPP